MHKPLAVVAALAALVALGTPLGAAAQQDDRPELPDLAPHEIEILGQLEISFPSLQRQPLVGFNPPPRLPEIPADRRPYVEDYKQESGDLPPSPIRRPEPPTIAGLATYEPARVEIDGSVGRYFSRAVRGRVGIQMSATESFLAHLEHRGLDSYQPFELDAPYSTFDAGIGFATNHARLSAGADVSGFLDTYSMYGASLGNTTGLLLEQPERDGRGIRTSAWIRTLGRYGPEAAARIDYETGTFETDVFDDDVVEGPNHRSSRRIAFDGHLGLPVGEHRLWIDGGISHSILDELTEANDRSTGYEVAGGVTLTAGRAMQLLLGGRIAGYRLQGDSEPLRTDVSMSKQSIAPEVRLEFYPGYGALIYAQSRPGMEANDLISLFEQNPFLVPEPLVVPSIRTIDAEAGARFHVGPVQIGVRGGYQDYASYLFFEHTQLNQENVGFYTRGFSAARYDEAIIMHAGGDVSVTVAQGLQATVGATGRHGRLGDDDDIIPYFGPVIGKAMLSYSFDRSRGLLQLTGTYESSRYRDREKTRQIGDFFDVDLLASYYVTPYFKVLFELDNISADYLERYDGYRQPSLVARVGAGLRW